MDHYSKTKNKGRENKTEQRIMHIPRANTELEIAMWNWEGTSLIPHPLCTEMLNLILAPGTAVG